VLDAVKLLARIPYYLGRYYLARSVEVAGEASRVLRAEGFAVALAKELT